MPRLRWTTAMVLSLLAVSMTGCPPTEPAMVTVDGAEGLVDLGDVAVRSAHLVVFRVTNPSDRTVAIRAVRSDCDCAEAVDPPQQLPPRSTTDVHVRFQAPGVALSYQTEVILETDDADRPFIRLKVKCLTQR